MAEHTTERLIIGADTRPKLPTYLKLRHDAGRGRWVILAPERVLTPNDNAVAILKLCDGQRSVMDIAAELATEYQAPAEIIQADVITMLQDLADKGYIRS